MLGARKLTHKALDVLVVVFASFNTAVLLFFLTGGYLVSGTMQFPDWQPVALVVVLFALSAAYLIKLRAIGKGRTVVLLTGLTLAAYLAILFLVGLFFALMADA